MSINLSKLAELAGVSVSTVSKAFSGSKEISEKTRQHIFEIAKTYNLYDKYNKNNFPKKVIGVICPEITSNYYAMFASLLNSEIIANHCIMTLSLSNFEQNQIEELFSYYGFYSCVDGIILIGSPGNIKNSSNIPMVAFGATEPCENIDRILFDSLHGVEEAVRYLKRMGHTQIGFASEKLTNQKLNLFMNAMRKEGLSVRKEWLKTSGQRFEAAGMEMAEEWLAEGTLPTAILAAYDYIAIGIIKTLKQHGLRIPEDISVIGMDDISVVPYLETSLSSIRNYTAKACRMAVDLIMKKIENKYYNLRQSIIIDTEFIPRESSGPAPKKDK